MPKPVTNAQIEDVLSSIRRLVSEDSRGDIRPDVESPAVQPAAAPAGAGVDRLVLTPSLRVDEETPAEMRAEPSGAEDFDAEVAEVVFDYADAEPEEAAELAAASLDIDATVEEMPSQWFDEDDAAEATDADLSAAMRQLVDRAAAEPEESPYVEPSFQSSRTESLTAKVAALEAAIGRTRDQWEPDGHSRDAYAGTRGDTIAWQDHIAETNPSAAAHVSEDGAPAHEDEAVLDEDALRELVAEIVRQELQGALGERITRNVRKLVRREIHRVIASQDLE